MAPDDPAQTPVAPADDQAGIHDDRARGLGIALAAAVIALLVLWWIFTQTTVVPDVVGQPAVSARQSIVAADLAVGDVTEVRTRQHEAGDVADQAPVGGARVLRGSSIDIAIARSYGVDGAEGIGTQESFGYDPSFDSTEAAARDTGGGGGIARSGGPWVPNVQAMTESRARSALSAAGYRVAVKYGPVTTGPAKGRVYFQDPEPDAAAARGSLVEIWISTGGPGTGNSDYKRPYAQPGER